MLIYCDPPYQGTESYRWTNAFNHEQFWETMREWSKHHIVIVSEEHAPLDFQSVWSCQKKRKLSSNKKKRLNKREHLFMWKHGIHFVGRQQTKKKNQKNNKTYKIN
jgi:DNA adenine methylase